MRTTLLLAVLGCLLVVPAATGKEARPFEATFDFTVELAASPTPCPQIRVNVIGQGHATHLGRFTTAQFHCVDPDDPLAFSAGRYTFTAADGSTISGAYSGRFVPTGTPGVLAVDGRWSIDDGTGRLAGARGGGTAEGAGTDRGGTVGLHA